MGNDLKCSLSHVGSSGVLSKNSHGLTNHSEILVWRTIGSKQSIAHGGIIRVKMTVSSLLLSPLLKETIHRVIDSWQASPADTTQKCTVAFYHRK